MKSNSILASLVLLLIGSCTSPAPLEDYIGILRDTSGSRIVPVQIGEAYLLEVEQTLGSSGSGKRVEVYDATSAAARPIAVHWQSVPEPLPAFDARYRQRQDEMKRVRSENHAAFQAFVGRATAPASATTDNSQSYLNKNLKVALANLMDSSYQKRILLIDSDLLDDPKGQPEAYISQKVVRQLNEAKDRGANIYLYSETDREVLDSLGLQVEILSHPIHFQEELRKIYNHPKNINYE